MSTPDVEDASPSPEHSGDEDENEMADENMMKIEDDSSPSTANGNGLTKPASNAKDPQRPRRKKARRACLACQRAHLTCGKCSTDVDEMLLSFRPFPRLLDYCHQIKKQK
jgi:hypothetical protein